MKTASCVSQCQNLTNVANCVVQCDFVGSWRNIKMLRHFAKVSKRSHWINLLISSSTYFITSAFFKECSYCQWKLAPRIWKHEDLTREPKSQNCDFLVKHSVKKTDFWKAGSSALQTQAFTTPITPKQIIFTGGYLIVSVREMSSCPSVLLCTISTETSMEKRGQNNFPSLVTGLGLGP